MTHSQYYIQETIKTFETYINYFSVKMNSLNELNTPEEFNHLQLELADVIRHQENFVDQELKRLMAGITDELLLQYEWNGRDWWQDNLLEYLLFKTYTAGDRIIAIAQELIAEANISRKGLAVAILDAIAIGFCGKYQKDDSALLKLRRDLSTWINNTYTPDITICPESYQHTLSADRMLSLPSLRKWHLGLSIGSLLMILLSLLLWMYLSEPVTNILDPLFQN